MLERFRAGAYRILTPLALFLNRQVTLDPKKQYAFVDDEEANRLRSEALREPWRL